MNPQTPDNRMLENPVNPTPKPLLAGRKGSSRALFVHGRWGSSRRLAVLSRGLGLSFQILGRSLFLIRFLCCQYDFLVLYLGVCKGVAGFENLKAAGWRCDTYDAMAMKGSGPLNKVPLITLISASRDNPIRPYGPVIYESKTEHPAPSTPTNSGKSILSTEACNNPIKAPYIHLRSRNPKDLSLL